MFKNLLSSPNSIYKLNKKKNILITGGCGFIGSHLAAALLKNNYVIHIIDKNIKNKISNKNITYFRGNIKNPKVFNNFKYKYDAVFHLAAQASARICEENFREGIESNFIGTVNLCNWAKLYRPKKVIFASSMAVYKSSQHPLKETEIVKPNSVYGKTKVESEKLIKNLERYNITAIITRLFNVYGPGQSYKNLKQGMVSIYAYYAIFDRQIKVTGSSERFRDLIYISDVIDTYIKLLKSRRSTTLNIGTGEKTTVAFLLKQICQLTNLDFRKDIKILSSHSGDVFGTYASTTRLKRINRPKIKLVKGLTAVIQDIKKFKRR